MWKKSQFITRGGAVYNYIMYFNMFLLCFVALFCSVLCYSEEDLGYSLNIGNAIDVFAK